MSLDTILAIFQSLILLRVAFLIILFLYVIFAFVVLNQVRLMNQLVHQSVISSLLLFIAFIHFLASLSLFILAVVIL